MKTYEKQVSICALNCFNLRLGNLVRRASFQRVDDCSEVECLAARIFESLRRASEQRRLPVFSAFQSVICSLGNWRDDCGLEVGTPRKNLACVVGWNFADSVYRIGFLSRAARRQHVSAQHCGRFIRSGNCRWS